MCGYAKVLWMGEEHTWCHRVIPTCIAIPIRGTPTIVSNPDGTQKAAEATPHQLKTNLSVSAHSDAHVTHTGGNIRHTAVVVVINSGGCGNTVVCLVLQWPVSRVQQNQWDVDYAFAHERSTAVTCNGWHAVIRRQKEKSKSNSRRESVCGVVGVAHTGSPSGSSP
jgi:hypothetical protein